MTDRKMEELDRYYMLWREISYLYEDWSKAHGLSFNEVMVLYSIYEDTVNCTQKMISQKWLIPKQSVNTILKDFERKRLVEFVPLQSDKRNKLIKPTSAGMEYADRIITELRRLELFIIEQMGVENITQLNDSMALFAELFKKGLSEKNV